MTKDRLRAGYRRNWNRKLGKTPGGRVRLAIAAWLYYCRMTNCPVSLSFSAIRLLRQMMAEVAHSQIYLRTRYQINEVHINEAAEMFDSWWFRCEAEDRSVSLNNEARDWFTRQIASFFAAADVQVAQHASIHPNMASQMRH